jgi:UDP-N-acetylglucosamine 3-dehydrogenase
MNGVLKAVVIGVGKMGTYHAKILKSLPSTNLVGVWTKTKKTAVSKKYLKTPIHTDLNLLLSDQKPDMAIIATPTSTHTKFAITCLQKGLHVLIEKPIAQNSTHAQKIINAANKSGKKVMIGHIERFNPVAQKAKKIISKNKLGKILVYSSTRAGKAPPNPTTSVLLDLGIHDIDLFSFLTNQSLKGAKILSHTDKKVLLKNQSDFATFTCQTSEKTIFHYQTDWLRTHPQRKTHIICQKGELWLDFFSKKLTLVSKKGTKQIPINPNVNQLKKEILAFVNSIKKDTLPLVTALQAKQVLEFYKKVVSK